MEHRPRSWTDGFAWSPPTDQLGFGPDPDHWTDPETERARDRRRVRVCLLAFSLTGFALALAALPTLGFLFFLVLRRPVIVFPDSWQFVESCLVTWCSFVGTCLLWGRWRDPAWQRRSGLLVLMGFADLILWSLDNAVTLGLSEQPIGHDWFCQCLGRALGWAELSLIAGLAGDVADHLGSPQSRDVSRGARTVSTIGATLWLAVVFFATRWQAPLWPLRMLPWNRVPFLPPLILGENLIYSINLIQVTALTIATGYVCAVALRTMRREDHAQGSFHLPSEAGWEDPTRPRW